MKPRRSILPYALLALAWLAFAAYVCLSAGQLHEHVATHFNAAGEPNGWETPAGYVRFTLIFGAAVPAFILGIFAVIPLGNGAGMNIPHKEYWLAPERRAETFAFVRRQGAWLAGLLIAFFAGIHFFILVANAHSPIALPPLFPLAIGGALLVFAIGWVASFIRYFYRKPA